MISLFFPKRRRGNSVRKDRGARADDPGCELRWFAQASQIAIRPQETFLRQVVYRGPIERRVRHNRPDEPRVAVVEAAERFAVSRQGFGHKLGVGRLVSRHSCYTSGRRGQGVQNENRRCAIFLGS